MLYFLESNYLAILLKANYENPVDTAEDILDRGLTVISPPGSEAILEMSKRSPSAVTRALAEVTVVPWVIILLLKESIKVEKKV